MMRSNEKESANNGPRRARVTGAILLVAASLVAGCASKIPPSEVHQKPLPPEVVVQTKDGRRVQLRHPFVWHGAIQGTVSECEGAAPLPPLEESAAGHRPRYQPMNESCLNTGQRGSIALHRVARIMRSEGISPGGAIATFMGVGAAVATTIGVAAVASSSRGGGSGMGVGGSCPRVYSFDGSEWHLDSGTYGAAFFEADQQTDHDLLEKLAPVDGEYRLRLANELDETEHVDALSLVVVDHPAGSRVVPAPDGELITFTSPHAPLRAVDLRGIDVQERVARRDGRLWGSDLSGRDPSRPEDTRDGLELVFAKPHAAKELKLSMTGMNTPEAVQIVFHLLSLQGDQLPALYDRLNSSALARKLMRRLYEGVGLLTVSVRTPNGWSQRGVFEAAGNEIAKAQALRIPIDDITGERIELRLESAVGMWHVDRVSVDYSVDVPVETHQLALDRATLHDGRDVLSTLSQIDETRLSTEKGDWAELTFTAPAPPASGMRRSFVVQTTGYDTLHVEPAAEPDPDAANAMMLSPAATSRRVLELRLATERAALASQ